MIVGTAGHIDHGKTALVRALTGVDTDRLPEEKRRGITIDLGFAPLSLDGIGTVGIIDVPGHEDFVRSMLVGASGIDLGLLVIAADEGVMPQTREHLLILSLLEIRDVVVAITKTDLVDAEWLSLVQADAVALFEEMPWSSPPIVPCSVRSGEGLDFLRATLAQRLASSGAGAAEDLFRLPVDRAFTVRGTGTVVTGTVWSGSIERDEVVRVLPAGQEARVRRIERHGRSVDRALARDRAAIALAGVDLKDVARGSVLVTEGAWRPTSMFEALVTLKSEAAIRVGARTRLRLHAGASETSARIVTADGNLRPGQGTFARITADSPIVLRGGDRFVLRLPAPIGTIGGGVVIDPYCRKRSLSASRAKGPGAPPLNPAARLASLLETEGVVGVPLPEIPIRVGCTPTDAQRLTEQGNAFIGPHNLFGADAVESTMASVRLIIAEYEVRSPLSTGVPTQTLREGLRANAELADISIREMERRGEIETAGPLTCRKGWAPTPSVSDVEVSNQLAHDICAAERQPPSVEELVSRHGNSVPVLLRYLERQGRIVQVETDRYYDRGVLEAMIALLREQLVGGQVYVPAQLRDVLGFSRKYLIPFLEFCDRNGVTERSGEGRRLRGTHDVFLDTSAARS